MNTNGDQKECKYPEKDNRMNNHRGTTSPHATKLHHPIMTRQLKQ